MDRRSSKSAPALGVEMRWLEMAATLAKAQHTRHLALQDKCILPQLIALVEKAISSTRPPIDNGKTNLSGTDEEDYGETNGVNVPGSASSIGDDTAPSTNRAHDNDSAAFQESVQASPEASRSLTGAFLALRDSCASCPANQNLLRGTRLPEAALGFAVDQAYFACGAPTPNVVATTKAAASDPERTVEVVGGARLAVRAALQFVCNWCVGNEANQASLWDRSFPRGLMELVNGLKTDRRLLSLAVALIHNCCVAKGRGRDRLCRLSADRAFCCLLMKVVPFDPNPCTPESTAPESAFINRDNSLSSDDPAAEWLYLLFCRFVQEHLLSDFYDAIGVRAGGRSTGSNRRDTPEMENGEVDEGCTRGRKREGDETVKVLSRNGDAAPFEEKLGGNNRTASRREKSEATWTLEAGEMDFFFPVTPEQLIMLNFTEITAGDKAVTGSERPTQGQRQTCYSLYSWLIELLAAMPLNQSLLHACDRETSITPRTKVEGHGQGGGGDLETAATRRRMREELRSAVLRALATLLARCDVGTRRAAAGYRAPDRVIKSSRDQNGTVFTESGLVSGAFVGGADHASVYGDYVGIDFGRSQELSLDSRSSVPDPPQPPKAATERGRGPGRGLVPLCLELLSWCGSAAEPNAKIVTIETGVECDNVATEATGRRGVPTGRKAELLKVIGNTCFRCEVSQDMVRELGALPLILNHCAVDGGNPLLREYALLAVRNLCEGNPQNQALIAALEPQGCSPGMEQGLADMGLEGRLDDQGKVRLDPLTRSVSQV